MEDIIRSEFVWRSPNSTYIVKHKGNDYWIATTQVTFDNYYISLYENKIIIFSCYTKDEEFTSAVIPFDSILEQILSFGDYMIQNHILQCPMCEKEKFVFELDEIYRQHQSITFEYLCFECEETISDDLELLEDDQFNIEELQKNPPKIIGGFHRKIDAYRALAKFDEYENIEIWDDGYVYAKGIIKLNDGTYYPVFLTIAIASGGEHCGTDYISDNWESPIPDTYAEQFIGKNEDDIYPYTYATIEHIEGDFHQDIWLGRYSGNDVQPHLVNFVGENWVRPYFSIQHLQSAAHLTRNSGIIEKNISGYISNLSFSEHRAYVTAGILSAVAFLESTINEIFSDIKDTPDNGVASDLDNKVIILINDLLENDVFKLPILKKYQVVLTLAGKKPFDKGKKLFQEISLVIKLRNSLVHFEPKNILINGDTSFKHLEGKFMLNPLTGGDNPFFPDKCLSYGCSKWALETCIEFTDEFFAEMEIIPLYYRYKNEIKKIIEML